MRQGRTSAPPTSSSPNAPSVPGPVARLLDDIRHRVRRRDHREVWCTYLNHMCVCVMGHRQLASQGNDVLFRANDIPRRNRLPCWRSRRFLQGIDRERPLRGSQHRRLRPRYAIGETAREYGLRDVGVDYFGWRAREWHEVEHLAQFGGGEAGAGAGEANECLVFGRDVPSTYTNALTLGSPTASLVITAPP